jgi:tRNA(Ile)-lysidine synthase
MEPLDPIQIPEDDPLLQAVRTTVRKRQMLRPGDAVLIGVSGGRDSTALMWVLTALAGTLRLRLGIAHLHHGLRGTPADRDARLVENLAFAAGLPFYYARIAGAANDRSHRPGREEAARERRYAFLEVTARRYGFDRIALGHHADDNAELVLMRLIRGSGPLGLAGIPPMRPGRRADLTIIRPLSAVDRGAINRFCRRHGLLTVEDETNQDRTLTRNRIRHDLLPRVRRDYNPNIVAGLNRLAALIRDEEDWLDTLVAGHLQRLTLASQDDHILLDGAALGRLHPALQRRLLRAALQVLRGDLRRIGFEPIEAVRRLLDPDKRDVGRVDLPGDLCAARRGRRLRLGRPAKEPVPKPFEYVLPAAGKVHIVETGARLCLERLDRVDRGVMRHAGQHVAYFDMNQIDFPITIRSFRPGDRFAPFGLRGTQKLKKYFIDHKIPRWRRATLPLVVSGGEIIWIAGLRRSARAPVGPRSRAVLRAELLVA